MPPEAVQDKPVHVHREDWLLLFWCYYSPDFDTAVSQSWRSIAESRTKPSRATYGISIGGSIRNRPSTKPHQSNHSKSPPPTNCTRLFKGWTSFSSSALWENSSFERNAQLQWKNQSCPRKCDNSSTSKLYRGKWFRTYIIKRQGGSATETTTGGGWSSTEGKSTEERATAWTVKSAAGKEWTTCSTVEEKSCWTWAATEREATSDQLQTEVEKRKEGTMCNWTMVQCCCGWQYSVHQKGRVSGDLFIRHI